MSSGSAAAGLFGTTDTRPCAREAALGDIAAGPAHPNPITLAERKEHHQRVHTAYDHAPGQASTRSDRDSARPSRGRPCGFGRPRDGANADDPALRAVGQPFDHGAERRRER